MECKLGCDIHAFVEAFNKENKRWERKTLYYKDKNGEFQEAWTLLGDRNYELFSRLVGVRGSGEPFVYPRGVPDDLSEEVSKEYCAYNDWHNVTWYDYCELKLYADTDRAFVEDEIYDIDKDEYVVDDRWNVVRPFIDTIDIILEAYGIYCPKPGEVRIVMWFDS